jgi:type III restriction enzyme
MLQNLIKQKTNAWLNQSDCSIKPILDYINKKGALRDAQIEALETYLFLKIKGQNKPLAQLMREGFFNENLDLNALPIAQKTRDNLNQSPSALALFEFAQREKKDLEPLVQLLNQTFGDFDTEGVINKIFYDIPYTDYLFSLPMGAGKTYLMAAIIYLDLYFALNEPQNPLFAHNFIILVPSGLKSSVIPSLKTIENFDPTWILPEAEAFKIKRLLTFEVLDQSKNSKKEQRKRNPNAQKVANHQPFEHLMGLVMVVNAEKVILDRLDKTGQLDLIEKTEDEQDNLANELRNIIGKIPNLQIHIDEVHHAQDDDIKLRQVVTNWNKTGAVVNSVLGYSGTPYLPSPEPIKITEGLVIKRQQITNTVYYYPLERAVRTFLKKPDIRSATMNDPLSIIAEGVELFKERYWNTLYERQNNDRIIKTTAKLAIYCSSIERLEEHVFPYLIDDLKIDPADILKYHRGNAKYKMGKAEDTAFAQLDTEISKVKIILLVQIGKEGWDCRSLTGVILSQKGDCPKNMTLQTACRCLREVSFHQNEKALIVLNDFNYKTLDAQLQDEQHTSIEKLNKANQQTEIITRERVSRLDFLKLPHELDFYRIKLKEAEIVDVPKPDPAVFLHNLLEIQQNNTNFAERTVREGNFTADAQKSFIEEYGSEQAVFNDWILQLMRDSFGVLNLKLLQPHFTVLKDIFDTITYVKNKSRRWNFNFDIKNVEKQIRLAFIPLKEIQYDIETVPHSAEWIKVANLKPVEESPALYPKKQEQEQILNLDAQGKDVTGITDEMIENANRVVEAFKTMGTIKTVEEILKDNAPVSTVLKNKKRTLHYTPYNFMQSNFEKQLVEKTLEFDFLEKYALELYFNGDRAVSDFQIECFDKTASGRYIRIGNYTPDFLMLQRKNDNSIGKILIIETKGGIYGSDFKRKRRFMEEDFVRENESRFGFKRFDFLYLEDGDPLNNNIAKLEKTIKTFFI